MLQAEPILAEETGEIVRNALATFRVVRETRNQDGTKHQVIEEVFTSEQVSRFNFSLSDNRLVKFNLVKFNALLDVKLIFESVHKKHQFAELLSLKPEDVQSMSAEHKDLKMLNLTWNMGGNDKISFVNLQE